MSDGAKITAADEHESTDDRQRADRTWIVETVPMGSDEHPDVYARRVGYAFLKRTYRVESMRPIMTAKQIDALEGPLSRMDPAYFVTNHTSLAAFEREHGRLPDDLRSTWAALEKAAAAFEESLDFHGVQR